jgi:hypothetical protein
MAEYEESVYEQLSDDVDSAEHNLVAAVERGDGDYFVKACAIRVVIAVARRQGADMAFDEVLAENLAEEEDEDEADDDFVEQAGEK